MFMVSVLVESSIAEMYKWVDQDGATHFSDSPPADINSSIETLPASTLPTAKTIEKDVGPQDNNYTENREHPSNAGDSDAQKAIRKEPSVELYITSWCPWCKKAKSFFRSREIQFVEYDIEKDKEAARRKEQLDSRRGVPFAVINGKYVHGYSEKKYNEALSH